MNKWEKRIWTSDTLTGFVAVLVTVVVCSALTLLGWTIDLLGGFDRLKAWWWKR